MKTKYFKTFEQKANIICFILMFLLSFILFNYFQFDIISVSNKTTWLLILNYLLEIVVFVILFALLYWNRSSNKITYLSNKTQTFWLYFFQYYANNIIIWLSALLVFFCISAYIFVSQFDAYSIFFIFWIGSILGLYLMHLIHFLIIGLLKLFNKEKIDKYEYYITWKMFLYICLILPSPIYFFLILKLLNLYNPFIDWLSKLLQPLFF